MQGATGSRRAWMLSLGGMALGLAAMLLTPLRPDSILVLVAGSVPLPGPLGSVSRNAVWWGLEDATNVLLFMPLGYALTRVLGRAIAGASAGILVSAAVEVAQLVVPGRVASLLDVACNSIGAISGALLAVALGRRSSTRSVHPGPRRSRVPPDWSPLGRE